MVISQGVVSSETSREITANVLCPDYEEALAMITDLGFRAFAESTDFFRRHPDFCIGAAFADYLIKHGSAFSVPLHFKYFTEINAPATAHALLDAGEGLCLLMGLPQFLLTREDFLSLAPRIVRDRHLRKYLYDRSAEPVYRDLWAVVESLGQALQVLENNSGPKKAHPLAVVS